MTAIAKAVPALALLLLQMSPRNDAPMASPQRMRYRRTIQLYAGVGQACALLDAQIFPHAAPSLRDLRIFPPAGSDDREIPYAITMSAQATEESQPAPVLNLGSVHSFGGRPSASDAIAFDLEMPARPYTEVTLHLAGHDFLATATVSGMDAPAAPRWKQTALGTFTLFDLSAQHLSHNTTLPLQESTFPYLHVVLAIEPAPGASAIGRAALVPAMVVGAQVPPSREAQTLYTTVAETHSIATVGRESWTRFTVPARVPIERVSFDLAPGFKGNFSRDVRITAVALPPEAVSPLDLSDDAAASAILVERASPTETIPGTIVRVDTLQGGREIKEQQLGVPAILGANLQRGANVEVAILNGDDKPLPIAGVRLEMRQRRLCFDVPRELTMSESPTLYYGDADLRAPIYDYERFFVPSGKPVAAELGPEMPNPAFHRPPVTGRPFTERHPALLWVALLAVILVLAAVALRSSRRMDRAA